MEGKMPLFYVPVSLWVQKNCFPTSTSAAQLHEPSKTQACKNRSATDSKWRNINGHELRASQTCMHLFKCVDTKQNIRALCIYAPVKCAHKSSSLLTCRKEMQAAHPFVLWHFIWPLPCLYVFANCVCLFSDILRDSGWMRGEGGASVSHRYTKRQKERQSEKC